MSLLVGATVGANWVERLGIAGITAAILLYLLIQLWRAKLQQEKSHAEMLAKQNDAFRTLEREYREDQKQRNEQSMAMVKEVTKTMTMALGVLHNVERILRTLDVE